MSSNSRSLRVHIPDVSQRNRAPDARRPVNATSGGEMIIVLFGFALRCAACYLGIGCSQKPFPYRMPDNDQIICTRRLRTARDRNLLNSCSPAPFVQARAVVEGDREQPAVAVHSDKGEPIPLLRCSKPVVRFSGERRRNPRSSGRLRDGARGCQGRTLRQAGMCDRQTAGPLATSQPPALAALHTELAAYFSCRA